MATSLASTVDDCHSSSSAFCMTGFLVLTLQLSALAIAFAILYVSQPFVIGKLLLTAPSRGA